MIAPIQAAKQRQLKHEAEQRGAGDTREKPQPERIGGLRRGRDEVGANHVQRAVRQIDAVHDAKDERQPGGQQEQHEAELQAVKGLLQKQLRHFILH